MKRIAVGMVCFISFAVSACNDRSPSAPEVTRETPPGFVVSNAVTVASRVTATGASAERESFLVDAASSVAYVSAEPGTFPNAIHAEIRNATRGSAAKPIAMLSGGFDPVSVDAAGGDDLSLTLFDAAGGVSAPVAIKVPPRRPPDVVRTSPPKGRTDVALNVRIIVVFSEPVDKSTVTRGTVTLLSRDTPAEGSVTVAQDGLSAEFVPDAELTAGTDYSLVIDQAVKDLDGDALQNATIATFTTGFDLSSAGELVFVQSNDNQIYRVNADGTGLTRLTTGLGKTSVSWSPDGQRISYAGLRSERNQSGFFKSDIYTMDWQGLNIVQRTTDSDFYSVAWSPDGRKLAISDQGLYFSDIYLVSPDDDGSGPVHFVSDGRSPAWSPDGTQIAYVHTSGDDGYNQVYVVNADGSDTHPISEDDGGAINTVSWAPDGKRLAFSKCLDGRCDIYQIGRDGSWLGRTTDVGNADQAVWSPDGKWIAVVLSTFSGQRYEETLAVVPATGGHPHEIVTGGYSPSWRPRKP